MTPKPELIIAFASSKNGRLTGAERVALAAPPPRVVRDRPAHTAYDNVISPFFRRCFAPLDTFIHGPLEFVVRVAKYVCGATSRVSVTLALFPWRTESLIEFETGGGE